MVDRFASVLAGICLSVIGLAASSAAAHEGHDHGAPPPPVSTTIAPRADASTADLELVAVARGKRLEIFIDSFKGNEPVNGAILEIDAPSGTLTAEAAGEGTYVATAPWLTKPGSYDLAITVMAGDLFDVLTVTMVIPEMASADVPVAAADGFLISSAFAQEVGARLQRQDMTLWAVGGGGIVVGLLLATLFRRRKPAGSVAAIAAVLLLAGAPQSEAAGPAAPTAQAAERDVAQRFADGSIFVPKTTQRILAIRTIFTEQAAHAGTVELPARIIPDPTTSGYVQASVSGRLLPPPGGFPQLGTRVAAGDVLALVQPSLSAADLTSQQQQARELDQEIMLVERKLQRFERLQSVVARAEIEDATLELQGLKARRANLEQAPTAAEKLTAPVSGVIAAAQAVAGQIAEPNTVIFQIIDPSRYWVEALSFDAHSVSGAARGKFMDGRTASLIYRGSGLADRNQAIPIHFSVEGQAEGIRAGQLLTVLSSTTDERTGIAVPRTSVLRASNGQSLVYEHTNAERFVPREVRTEPLDGDRLLIVSGIEAGKRIVTQGTELLNQIR
ncbi:HlyD family efflux transporter periplasmic adaptor subunit (plasmid) [Peteryoungia desertarenae]|uniref:HlyD family efflux transporter periplasmic adaptor subunit n=1 Tax=Peteryoungia desertarenae TaxID=1813451 RepID=A0ABX6QST3_9HYPH|nr:HlyD family efflux transporter periplasmic adaptor subunit [Peteryoungia desertarenae]QLF71613.1 HlyD family efflux transporter periplasmic adaptor subunit [Peteryoungia desertarenae]